MTTRDDITQAYMMLVSYLAENTTLSPAEVENLRGSAIRAAKAFMDMVAPRVDMIEELKSIFSVRFPSETRSPQLVMQGNIRVVCICPHHLLPVEGMVHYGYVTEPGRPVIGLSKLVRIAKLVGRRAVIQEQLAQDLVDVLSEGEIGVEREDPQNGDTKPSRHKYQIGETVSKNVGVVINAAHGCMTCRGVMSQSRTHTSLFTGLLGKQRWQLDFYRGIDETGRLTP